MSPWLLKGLNIVISNDHPEVTLAKSEDWILLLIAQAVRYNLWSLGLVKDRQHTLTLDRSAGLLIPVAVPLVIAIL